MTHRWIVLKFGGTSVAGRRQWDAIERLVAERRESGYRVLVVCSALAGVTDRLHKLLALDAENAHSACDELVERHQRLADELGVEASGVLSEWAKRLSSALSIVDEYQGVHEDSIVDENLGARRQAAVLSLGEWICTRIGERFLSKQFNSAWVDAREALQSVPEPAGAVRRAWLTARCEAGPDRSLRNRWSKLAPVLVTQGFVASSAAGDTVLLGRGGSDTSAALLASRMSASATEIWTDVPGLFTADPRRCPEARLLRQLSHAEALEMAAGGAAVIHPRSIRAAADSSLPIEIRDLNRPADPGTRIVTDETEAPVPEGVRAVVSQRRMAVLLLENLDIRQQVGFLAWVFSEISQAGISVDLVATSETTTTLALDRDVNHLDEKALTALTRRLEQRCKVRLYPDCASVNLVGHGARLALEGLGEMAAYFRSHPLLMLSQSANDLCISLLVRASHAPALMDRLHERLISDRHRAGDDGAFGPSWAELHGVPA